jgi:hypothetical protein
MVDERCGPVDIGDPLTAPSRPVHAIRAEDLACFVRAIFGNVSVALANRVVLVPKVVTPNRLQLP